MRKTDKREKIIVVASEPLTFEKADWMEIPTNTLVVITGKMNVLQLPIRDEHALGVEDRGKVRRDPTFAIKTGFPPSMAGATSGAEEVGGLGGGGLRGSSRPPAEIVR